MDNNNEKKIGLNSFVKRQVKGSGKTYSTISFEQIINHAEAQFKNGCFKKGLFFNFSSHS